MGNRESARNNEENSLVEQFQGMRITATVEPLVNNQNVNNNTPNVVQNNQNVVQNVERLNELNPYQIALNRQNANVNNVAGNVHQPHRQQNNNRANNNTYLVQRTTQIREQNLRNAITQLRWSPVLNANRLYLWRCINFVNDKVTNNADLVDKEYYMNLTIRDCDFLNSLLQRNSFRNGLSDRQQKWVDDIVARWV